LAALHAPGRRPWIGWAVGAISFTLAFLARHHFSDALASLPLLTFFLAVLITSFAGGWQPAAAVVAASVAAASYFGLPSPGTTRVYTWPRDLVALAFFVIIAATQIALVHRLTKALARLEWKRAQIEAMRANEHLMFSELQHRVANGIQLVASLLSLEATRVETTEDAIAVLDDAVTRLSVIATIHRRLHDPALGEAGFEKALETLTRDILSAAGRQSVAVTVQAPRLAISPAEATTLSMIVAEAVTNTIKHAFAGRASGRIHIRFDVNAAGHRRLTVEDDGPGFAALPDVEDGDSLGLLVMSSMAQRLGGSLEFGNAPTGGATVTVAMPPMEAGTNGRQAV
jgi:two-component sensor histidine kinase